MKKAHFVIFEAKYLEHYSALHIVGPKNLKLCDNSTQISHPKS
jgi:hypothetical protein